jgi:N-acetylglucosaminyl-diphospho-decaprenol L-rhamnosyltransferase
MKLSIVIICWNDLKVLPNCLKSIFEETRALDFEVIVADNGSTDGSVDFIRKNYPQVAVVENGANIGFARGNNAGIALARGEYVLILNPDTIILDRALEKLVAFADTHPEAGAFGPRVLNPNRSLQISARPLPTISGYLIKALYARALRRLSPRFESDLYLDWSGRTERPIGYAIGCALLVRGELLKRLGGFDERFFYHFEETDLCYRVWQAGSSVYFCPSAEIVHLGGASVARAPIRFTLETYRNLYRFFYKHYGRKGLITIRWINLLGLGLRYSGHRIKSLFKKSEALENRLKKEAVSFAWNLRLDPVEFIKSGKEPDLGYAPLSPAPIENILRVG